MTHANNSIRRLSAVRWSAVLTKGTTPLIRALQLLFDPAAPYEAVEIAIVLAIVAHGFAPQPDSGDLCSFPGDAFIARRVRVSVHSFKRWIAEHCRRERPVIGRSWPGSTWGGDNKQHTHQGPRYTFLETPTQVAAARERELEHQRHEQARAAKMWRTRTQKKIDEAAKRAALAKAHTARPAAHRLSDWGPDRRQIG